MFDGADFQSDEVAAPSSLRRAPTAAVAASRLALASDEPEMAYVPRAASGRYGESKRPNVTALVVAAAVHVVAIAAVLLLRGEAPQERLDKRLTVVNLTPPPPPPAQQTPPPSKPDIVAPRTPIQLVQKTPVAVTPDPVPQPTPSAPVSAPAIAPAPGPSLAAAPAPPSTVRVSDLSARMTSGAPPRYPMDSRRKREQGTVVLSLVLGTDGRVETISVSRSSGFDRLDQAALSAVRKWRWAPMVQNGNPVQMKGVVEIPFVLKD